MSVEIYRVLCPYVDNVWPSVHDGLDAAMEVNGGEADAHWLWQQCRSGAAYLFVFGDVDDPDPPIGASVWLFEKWSSGRKLRCLALYGSRMEEWFAKHETMIQDMARTFGANGIISGGREGWGRKVRGARRIRTLYEVAVLTGDERQHENNDAEHVADAAERSTAAT